MKEEEFNSFIQARPFTSADARQLEAKQLRSANLGRALWGRTPADLQRQLLASHPEIPAGFELADFLDLLQNTQAIAAWVASASNGDPKYSWFPSHLMASPTIKVGAQQYMLWDARCEVVRRAIEYLEHH